MPRALRTNAAEHDLDEIAWYLAVHENRPQIAYKNIDEIISKCDLLASNPLLGTAKPEFGNNYRAFSHKRWVIIFRSIKEGIEVMRIVDGSRDYPKIF